MLQKQCKKKPTNSWPSRKLSMSFRMNHKQKESFGKLFCLKIAIIPTSFPWLKYWFRMIRLFKTSIRFTLWQNTVTLTWENCSKWKILTCKLMMLSTFFIKSPVGMYFLIQYQVFAFSLDHSSRFNTQQYSYQRTGDEGQNMWLGLGPNRLNKKNLKHCWRQFWLRKLIKSNQQTHNWRKIVNQKVKL